MQQTETYKLNLIETSDTFSPAPLNENAQKIEAQLQAVQTAQSVEVAALDQRLTVLEGHKAAAGTYKGNVPFNDYDSWQSIQLGFTPRFVIVQSPTVCTWMTSTGYPMDWLAIEEGGFKVKNSTGNGSLNKDALTYGFFAIL